jgi:hypothetical protein
VSARFRGAAEGSVARSSADDDRRLTPGCELRDALVLEALRQFLEHVERGGEAPEADEEGQRHAELDDLALGEVLLQVVVFRIADREVVVREQVGEGRR